MRQKLAWKVFCATVLAAGCNATKDVMILQAQLTPGGEVPPKAADSGGACGFNLQGRTIRYSIEVHSINTVIGAHVHSGAAGVNGPIRVSLFPGPGKGNFTSSPTGPEDGILIEGSFADTDVGGVTFDQLVNEMSTGAAYCNVHTTPNPGGEIRGQITLIK